MSAETRKIYQGRHLVQIPLTQGQVAIIDAKDATKVLCFKWCARKPGKNKGWYAVARIDGHVVQLHRFIFKATKGVRLDHVNGDSLDNRRSNLRVASRSQNSCNQKRHRDNKSGFKGVWGEGASWRAKVMKDGKQFCLGHFSTPKEAAAAYNQMAPKLHGKFARLNPL